MYSRFVVGSSDGFIYVGIGYGAAHLVAYQISTGSHRDILPTQFQLAGAAVYVYPGAGGKVYASVGNQSFRLDGFSITPVAASLATAAPRNVFSDGSTISVSNGSVKRTSASGQVTTYPFAYTGEPLFLFPIGLGPDSLLYASSILPIDLLRADPVFGGLTNLGQFGGGEAYSLMAYGGRLRMAAYSGVAPLLSLDLHDPSPPGRMPIPRSPTSPARMRIGGRKAWSRGRTARSTSERLRDTASWPAR